MFDIKFLKSTGHFNSQTYEKGEMLFDEGEINEYLYIVESGALSVEKYTTNERTDTKQLAILRKGEFLGEGSLNSYFPKEVKVVAQKETQLIHINAKDGFTRFMGIYPEQAKDLLTYIISITNKRLSTANKYITSIYEINKIIRELESVSFKEIFKVLDTINLIIEGDFLLFLEVNPVMKSYLTLKYDTRNKGRMKDLIVEKGEYSLEEIGIGNNYKILTKEVVIGSESLGYIIIARESVFTENEKRIFLGMVNSLAGVLKQKKTLEEERDKEFSRV